MLLKEYINILLKEKLSYNKITSITNSLNRLASEHKKKNSSHHVYYDIIKVVDQFGLKKIGAGIYRKAYAIAGEDWVLKFAYGHNDVDYLDALETIEDEVNISQGMHGMGPRDIFVQVYDWDKISDKPAWIITQRVTTLSKASRDAGESISIEALSNIFPTFWNSLYNDSIEKKSKNFFCDFVADTMNEMSISTNSGDKVSGLSKKDFYDAMKEASIFEENIKPFEAIDFNADFVRIAQACAYSRPDDMHSGNIGIVKSSKPDPNDIVILDYMIDPYLLN